MVQYRFVVLAAAATTTVTAKISVQVHRNLEVAKQSNIVVKFRCDEAHDTHRRRLKAGASRTETIKSLVNALEGHTATSQASVKSLLANQLESTAVEVATTWIDCSMYIDNAPGNIVQEIATLPEVESIDEPVTMALSETKSDNKPASDFNENIQWGIEKIQAPALWDKGIKGDGIVVANIDSGVRYTHESLKSNWRQEYGWFDPKGKTALPNDETGHGTHVMGIMVGNTQGIGVAPNAQWIACKACYNTSCAQHLVVKCAEFLLCPHDKDGNNRDCDMAPHVINSSLGKFTTDFWLERVITAWRLAGIIPVFPNGNDGAWGCSFSDYPAASPQVIAVGCTDFKDSVNFHSSLGPSVTKLVKPDISAPGINIRSAAHSSDTAMRLDSGTSMSAPYVAGAIALYLSANRGATYDQVYMALTQNSDTETLSTPEFDLPCGDIPSTQYPNNHYGYGRLNIFKALTIRPQKCTNCPTKPPTTCGTVEDNTDYAGNNLVSTNQADVESCCADCKRITGCQLFVWTNHSGGTCWLKHTKGIKTTVVGAKAGLLLAGPPPCGTVESNVEFVGQDVAQVSAGQAADCCAACHSNQACNAYSWFSGVCYLKDRRAETKVASGVVSARVDKCSSLESDVDYVGNDLSAVTADVADCCAMCRQTSGCGAFTWANGVCYLKSSKGDIRSRAGFTSAVIN
ncbi:hypothetical protein DYB25_011873 [Aphanomyces astaci]|uniref:subtilisin n=2 Tax=Aphanomyces astaci TaxID=112090 RepID=A0A397A3K7_APHAT|nr:hypothetical protein DYB25_011873 [Aphanomyces astaci]RHY49517.1 hypothetical protein DYB38_006138 [Aphanomyces astaci]RHY74687.1 hypothetical protein DYB34_009820 [Aphanomyces astaci]